MGGIAAFNELDYQNVSIIYHFIKTGTIIGLGLKYAGTGNEKLKKIILEYFEEI